MKGPEPFLDLHHVQVPCPVRKGRLASVRESLRVVVGHDVFYFAGPRERDRFVSDPLKYARRLTDPVTLARFRPTSRSPRIGHRDRLYYFSGDSTFAAFKATPDSFAVRRGM